MTNPFGTMSTGGNWLKPAEINGHVLIIANVKPFGRRYDEMRKAEVDVATFDVADVTAGTGWQVGVNSSHAGITNKLQLNAGNPAALPVLGRIAQVPASNGHQAWVLADMTQNPAEAPSVQAAAAWLQANPVPATVSPFAQVPAPVVAPAVAPVAQPVIPATVPAEAQPAVADLLAQLQAQQLAGQQ